MFLDYSRNIEIKENIFIDEYDIFLIYKTNLASLLLENTKKMCFNCDKIFNGDNNINLLDCNCQMCKDCLNKFISQATNGDMVLNKFEKSN